MDMPTLPPTPPSSPPGSRPPSDRPPSGRPPRNRCYMVCRPPSPRRRGNVHIHHHPPPRCITTGGDEEQSPSDIPLSPSYQLAQKCCHSSWSSAYTDGTETPIIVSPVFNPLCPLPVDRPWLPQQQHMFPPRHTGTTRLGNVSVSINPSPPQGGWWSGWGWGGSSPSWTRWWGDRWGRRRYHISPRRFYRSPRRSSVGPVVRRRGHAVVSPRF